MINGKKPDEGDEFVRELALRKYNELKSLVQTERDNAENNKQTAKYSRRIFWVVAVPMSIALLLIIVEYIIMFRL